MFDLELGWDPEEISLEQVLTDDPLTVRHIRLSAEQALVLADWLRKVAEDMRAMKAVEAARKLGA
jgi:hypothetical protein